MVMYRHKESEFQTHREELKYGVILKIFIPCESAIKVDLKIIYKKLSLNQKCMYYLFLFYFPF